MQLKNFTKKTNYKSTKETKVLLLDIVVNGTDIIEPLGMASIASVLRENNYTTRLIACNEKDLPITELLASNFNLVGLSVQHNTINYVADFCKLLKKTNPSAVIAVGGYICTYHNEFLLKCHEIDLIVKGEGEYTFLEIANRIEDNDEIFNIRGIVYRDNDCVIENAKRTAINDLDDLPFPSRDILSEYNIKLAQVESSRGCVSSCSFCSLHRFWADSNELHSKPWRPKSVKRFVDEIEMLNNTYKVERFTFLDCSYDNPNKNSQRVMSIATEILDRNLEIYYYINVRATFYKIANNKMMDKLMSSGLLGIFLGLESFYENDILLFGKPASLDDNIRAIDYFQKFDINLDIGLINFHPYTTFEGLIQNAKYLKRYGYSKRTLFFSPLHVFKGTQLYNKIEYDGLLCSSYLNNKEFALPKFKFVDRKVELLYEFLNSFILERGEKMNRINYYGNDHHDIMIYLKRKFINTKGAILLDKYYTEFNAMNKDYINRTYECFMRLVEIADRKWNDAEAAKAVDEFLCDCYLNTYLNMLEKNKMRLFLSLSRIEKSVIFNL